MSDKKECIERGALLQDIEENVLFTVRGGAETPTPEMRGVRKVIGRIEAARATDVVEVVRCEACKKAVRYHHPKGGYLCTLHGKSRSPVVKGGDYCSYGERKYGDNNAAD